MDSYKPLTVKYRPRFEKEGKNIFDFDETRIRILFLRKFFSGWRRLHEKWPGLILYPGDADPPEVKQVREQLEKRTEFPLAEWRKITDEIKEAEFILRIIGTENHWPNHNFIPNDLLEYLLFADDAFNHYCITKDLVKAFGLNKHTFIDELYANGYNLKTWTIADFVKYILHKRTKFEEIKILGLA